MDPRRQDMRRLLMQQLVELCTWTGDDLLALVQLPPSRLSGGDTFVRQIRPTTEGDFLFNLRIELSEDQSNCEVGTTRIQIEINDGARIETADLYACGPVVKISDRILSLGKD
jgi:hypothetical protein